MYSHAAARGSHVGGHWTYEQVDHLDLRSFERSQLQQEGLGLCDGDQIAVLFCGRWTAGFVGIIGDPYDRWPTILSSPLYWIETPDGKWSAKVPLELRKQIPLTVQTRHVVEDPHGKWKLICLPRPDLPFIDVTIKVAEGQGIQGIRQRELIQGSRNWRENFCCSYIVKRVYQDQWASNLMEIDGATIVINRESNKVLRRLSTSPEQQDAFLQGMQRPQRYQGGHFGERSYNHRSPPRARGQHASRGASTRSEGFHRGRYAFSAPSNQEHWPRDQPVREKPFHGQWTDSGSPRRDGACSSRGSSGIDGLAWRNAWRPVAATAKPTPAPALSSKTVVGSKSMAKPASASSYKTAADSKSIAKPASASSSKTSASSKSIAKLASALSVKTAAGSKSMAQLASALSSKTAASSKSMAKPASASSSKTAVSPKSIPTMITPTMINNYILRLSCTKLSENVLDDLTRRLNSTEISPKAFQDALDALTDLKRQFSSFELSPDAYQEALVALLDHESLAKLKLTVKPDVKPKSDLNVKPESAPIDSFGAEVAECTRKYGVPKIQPRRPKGSRNTRRPTRPEVGDAFKTSRSVQHEVNPAAKRRLTSLDRRESRRCLRLGLTPAGRRPSVTFSPANEGIYFDGEQAHLAGTISLPPDLVDPFLINPSLTFHPPPALVNVPARVLPAPRVREPLPIAPPPLVDSSGDTEDTGAVQPPAMEFAVHSPEGVSKAAATGVVSEEQAPEDPAEDLVPEGAIDSYVEPTVSASTKPTVSIDSRRALGANVVIPEGVVRLGSQFSSWIQGLAPHRSPPWKSH